MATLTIAITIRNPKIYLCNNFTISSYLIFSLLFLYICILYILNYFYHAKVILSNSKTTIKNTDKSVSFFVGRTGLESASWRTGSVTISLIVRQLADLPTELYENTDLSVSYFFVGRTGLEPVTISLKGCCSTN